MSCDSFATVLSETLLIIDGILSEECSTDDSSKDSLPAYGDVVGRLPNIQNTLRAIAKARRVNRRSHQPGAEEALASCRDNARELKEIVHRSVVSLGASGRLEQLIRSLRLLGREGQVDCLLRAMEDDIRPLADHCLLPDIRRRVPRKSVRWGDVDGELSARTKLERFQVHLQGLENRHASLKIFRWLCCSFRPITLDELRWALALDVALAGEMVGEVPLKMGFIRDDDALERRVETLSHGLIEIVRHEKKALAQFIHPTISEYFKNVGLAQLDHEATSPMAALARGHVCIARECLHSFTTMSSADEIPDMPLYPYASMFWPAHLKEAEERGFYVETITHDLGLPSETTVNILARGCSQQKTGVPSMLHLLMERRLIRTLLSSLPQLVEAGEDVNSRDSSGMTPLAIASAKGYEKLVSALRLHGADPNICDVLGVSPLGHAAKHAGKLVAANLLDPNPPAYHQCASSIEVDSLATVSVDRNSNCRAVGHDASHPRALDNIIQIQPDRADGPGRTPLAIAASCGNVEVLKLLLETREVKPDVVDANGLRPLALAAKSGHLGVVDLLVRLEGVDSNARDHTGATPLCLAAEGGYPEVVALLAGVPGVDLNSRDQRGRTPLWRAIRENQTEVTQLLIDTGGVDVNVVDQDGETLLSYMVKHNRHRTLRKILAMDELDRNKMGKNGETAVHVAARYGHSACLDHLLSYPDAKVDEQDASGLSPLMAAALQGKTKIVKRLLDMDEVDVNRTDSNGRSAIMVALKSQNPSTAHAILDSSGVDLSLADHQGRTALSWAVQCRKAESLVQGMLLRCECDANAADRRGWTPLIHAVQSGSLARMANVLIGSEKVDVSQADLCQRTPLSWSVSGGNKDVVVALLARRNEFVVDQADYQGRTPLSWAAAEGCLDCALALMNHEGIDIDARDIMGRSPLFWAMSCGQIEVARMLLATGNVNLHPRDANGLGPLDLVDDLQLRSRFDKLVEDSMERTDGVCFSGQPWIPYPGDMAPEQGREGPDSADALFEEYLLSKQPGSTGAD